MKHIIFLIAFLVVIVGNVQAQTFNVAPATQTGALTFYIPTITATDTSIQFYAPFQMQVLGLHVIATRADTGSASPSGVFTLQKNTGLTSVSTVATATVTTRNIIAFGTPATPAIGNLIAGRYHKIRAALSTGDTLTGVNVIVWYAR